MGGLWTCRRSSGCSRCRSLARPSSACRLRSATGCAALFPQEAGKHFRLWLYCNIQQGEPRGVSLPGHWPQSLWHSGLPLNPS